MKEFKSKHSLEDLVEFEFKKDEENKFGKIVSITFYKCDAVNYATVYHIEEVNSKNHHNTIGEQLIKKNYGRK